ncbi:MAG: glycosyltransferase family 1 protein, partial [Pseudomonadota bacterium]
LFAGRRLRRALDQFAPHAIHISTEGPLGLAARRYCIRNGLAFTTSYHTQFPAYIAKRFPIPESWSYRFVRWFHNRGTATLVPTPAVRDELLQRSFNNPVLWGRGVDTQLFKPNPNRETGSAPIFMYVGRIAVEKNLEAFASLSLPGRKVIVGDGPDFQSLKRRFPDCEFTGYRFGQVLADTLATADVFVFPSKTDTFGLVMLEAMACGVPVAAFPVPGPIDVVTDGVTGILNEQLDIACEKALSLSRDDCRQYALAHSWVRSTEQFASHLVDKRTGEPLVKGNQDDAAHSLPPLAQVS